MSIRPMTPKPDGFRALGMQIPLRTYWLGLKRLRTQASHKLFILFKTSNFFFSFLFFFFFFYANPNNRQPFPCIHPLNCSTKGWGRFSFFFFFFFSFFQLSKKNGNHSFTFKTLKTYTSCVKVRDQNSALFQKSFP